MKRLAELLVIFILLVSILAILGCASLPVANQPSPGSFKDAFAEADLHGWRTLVGTWTTKDGKLIQTDKSLGGNWFERPKIIANYDVETDFRIETDFSHQSGGSIGVMFRYHDNGQTLFVIFHDGAGVIVGKVDNPREKESGDWYPYPYDLSKDHKAAIEVHGSKIDVYLDGALAASNDKWGSAYPSGEIGLSTWLTAATFDNVIVSPLK